ncbi:MAG: GntR family transcriptional regulator [Paracoccus sp. (in: a-proteobacteria)]|nr:GntR family transcriptional regulator [Paracoccus sp. (in: a-proteobacteria)]
MQTSQIQPLPSLDEARPRTITDQIFEVLYDRVVTLALPPGAKLSEAEVAAQMGVSRQPVRDAFFRLSQLGFIQIRPQRATTVTPISEEAVLQAYFIRRALEEAVMISAAATLKAQDLDDLALLIAQQDEAISTGRPEVFHALDDEFHHMICARAGLDFVWSLVKDNKGHMDRARYLSLSYNGGTAVGEHRQILAALKARDPAAAAGAVHRHLSRIEHIIARLHIDRPEVFAGTSEGTR